MGIKNDESVVHLWANIFTN